MRGYIRRERISVGKTDYTVKELAGLAGVSIRTLHHYDRIGLLVPRRLENGYRVYGDAEVERLQLILLYRATGMSLEEAGRCLDDSETDVRSMLMAQREKLIEQHDELEMLIATVDKTIDEVEGKRKMEDSERFEGLKHRMVEENERRYGAEARALYGDDAIDASKEKILGETAEQFAETEDLEQQIRDGLREAMGTGDPSSLEAQRVCDLHRRWICRFWKEGSYSREAHLGLAQLYVTDGRFKKYYDDITPGAAQFLCDALKVYCGGQAEQV